MHASNDVKYMFECTRLCIFTSLLVVMRTRTATGNNSPDSWINIYNNIRKKHGHFNSDKHGQATPIWNGGTYVAHRILGIAIAILDFPLLVAVTWAFRTWAKEERQMLKNIRTGCGITFSHAGCRFSTFWLKLIELLGYSRCDMERIQVVGRHKPSKKWCHRTFHYGHLEAWDVIRKIPRTS